MCIWSGGSRSRLGQTSFLPLCLLPLIIYTCERLTLAEATWCLEAIHPVRVRVSIDQCHEDGTERGIIVYSCYLGSGSGHTLGVVWTFRGVSRVFAPVATVLGVVVVPW